MNEKPISHDEIFNQLNKFQAMDCKYSDGRILGSMCTEAHPIAKEAFFKFIDSNLGDPGLFKGTKLLEDKVLKMIYSIFSEMYRRYLVKVPASQQTWVKKARGVNPDKEKTGPPRDFTE